MPDTLRVGVLVDGFQQPRWVRWVLEEIVALPNVRLVLAVQNQARLAVPRGNRISTLWRNRKHLGYALYSRIDGRRRLTVPDPLQEVAIDDLLAGCATLAVTPRATAACDYISDDDVRAIEGYQLDVALRFGFRILKGAILNAARHGIWSYHHGDHRAYRGGPPAFWEMLDDEPVTGAILQVLTDELDNGRVLDQCRCATQRFSARRNLAHLYWRAAPLMARQLRQLQSGVRVGAVEEVTPSYRPYSRRLYRIPTNGQLLKPLARLAATYVVNKLAEPFRNNQWFVAYQLKSHGTGKPEGVPSESFYGCKHLIPPGDRFWADPFPVVRGGRNFIFLEEYEYAKGRGHISVVEVTRDGACSAPVPVLTPDYHLSYPFVFEWDDRFWMIPESVDHGKVELYRCTEFPYKWELDRVLLDGVHAVDATLVCHDHLWWMFFNGAEPTQPNWDQELHLYYAESPLGPWTPHRLNPVKSDITSTRPAGRIFELDGQLYRPAQDCSRRYGYAITINRIVRLDREAFVEEAVSRIEPEWADLVGTHTINAAGGLTCIDGLRRRWSWPFSGGKRRIAGPVSEPLAPALTSDHLRTTPKPGRFEDLIVDEAARSPATVTG